MAGLRANSQVYNVKSFGACGNGKNDDTQAIQAAIEKAALARKGSVYFPTGTYLIGSFTKTPVYLENYCLYLRSNISLKGDGKTSVIKIASHLFDKADSSANAHLFYGKVLHNLQFENLMINMNGNNNLTPEGVKKNGTAIFIKNSNNVIIKNITVKNCAGRNMILILGKGKNLLIENSSFINGGYNVGTSVINKFQDDFSFLYSEWDSSNIVNNIIKQENIKIALRNYTGGIEIHGSYSKALKNKVTGCFPGLYIRSSWYAIKNISVEDNKFLNCVKGILILVLNPISNVTIHNNEIQLTESLKVRELVQAGIEIPNGNSLTHSPQEQNNAALTNISIKNNIITSVVADNSDVKTAGMVLHSLQQSIIKNNTIKGMNYGGIVLQGSKWGIDVLSITGNTISGFKYNTDEMAICAYLMITSIYSAKDINFPGLKNIYVTKNNFIFNTDAAIRSNSIAFKRKFTGAYVAAPTIDQIHFKDNNFSNKKEGIKMIKTD